MASPRNSWISRISINKESRSDDRRRSINPAIGGVGRVIFPRDASRLHDTLRLAYNSRKNPSLSNMAQWYLDSRYPTEGPDGLLYQVGDIPPAQTAESVATVIDGAVAALRSHPPEPPSPPPWDIRADHEPFSHESLTSDNPPISPTPSSPPPFAPTPYNSVIVDDEFELPANPVPDRSPFSEKIPISREDLTDLPETKEAPTVDESSTSMDDMVPQPFLGPPSLLPSSFSRTPDNQSGSSHEGMSLAPDSRLQLLRNEGWQPPSPIRRKAGARDLKGRAATHPQPAVVPPHHVPSSLRAGSPITGRSIPQAPVVRDPPKTRIHSVVRKSDLPQSLQVGGRSSRLISELDAGTGSVRNSRVMEADSLPQPLQVGDRSSCIYPGFDFGLDSLHNSTAENDSDLPSSLRAKDRSSRIGLDLDSGLDGFRDFKVEKDNDLPSPLQAEDTSAGFGPGSDTEMENLISKVDAVKDSFTLQLDPLEQGLGKFSCDFSSIFPAEPLQAHGGRTQSKKSGEAPPRSSTSDSFFSDQASTSKSYATSRTSSSRTILSETISSRGPFAENGNSRHLKQRYPPNPGESLRRTHSRRPTSPRPLAPEPRVPARQNSIAKLAVSNAVLKAILAADDDSNHSPKAKEKAALHRPLSKRSAAVVEEFGEFTHRALNPESLQWRCQSEGFLRPEQGSPPTPKPESPHGQKRASTVDSLAIRKLKGKGIIFVDGWDSHGKGGIHELST